MASVYHFEQGQAAFEARVREFKADVAAGVLPCIRRHITTGDPAGLSQATYYDLRREVADWLELHPSCVVVIGSCRTGFSIKPEKRYAPFTSTSDIDVAVVSEGWFRRVWDDVFEAIQPNRDWVLTDKQGRTLGRDFFSGWVTPDELPPLPGVVHAQEWAEWFAGLRRRSVCNRHKIQARLYRDWERLERYQSYHVSMCHLAVTGAGGSR